MTLKFIAPMEAKSVTALPEEAGWQFEPKWDGFRCLAIKDGKAIEVWGKSGKPLGRFFPEVLEMLTRLPHDRFILDGELLIALEGSASFDALQQRLHPAESRIRKLSSETPATLVAFDLLNHDGEDWQRKPLVDRRKALEAFARTIKKEPRFKLSPVTSDPKVARRWFDELSQELDGVVAKRLNELYQSGLRAMLKLKRVRSADCVVGGFRYGTDTDLVGSLLLGLYDSQGKLDHVGFTSAFAKAELPALTRKIEALKGGSGFTGKAPGGPSRWSTERSAEWVSLEPELVVEVGYDQITADRFRHGTRFIRWRPDKAPRSCTFEQLATPVAPDAVIKAVVKTSK